MKIYDVNTVGNNFDNNFNINTPSNFTVSSSAGCNAVICTKPTIIPTIIQATCTGSTANSDASIAITTTNGDKYRITNGGTSTETYASATALITTGNLIGIANPTLPTQYTIRVFNGSDACFKDTTVTLNPKDCVMPE